MRNIALVKQLYVAVSVIFMISCDQSQVTVFRNCIIPSYPTANSIACANGKIISIGKDLNGYALEDIAIDYLEQTPLETLDPNNVLDAEGIRGDYLETLEALCERYEKECLSLGADYVRLDTSMRFDRALIEYLSQRRARF